MDSPPWTGAAGLSEPALLTVRNAASLGSQFWEMLVSEGFETVTVSKVHSEKQNVLSVKLVGNRGNGWRSCGLRVCNGILVVVLSR